MAEETKWHGYYAAGVPPWDTQAPASQLKSLIETGIIAAECHSLVEGRRPQALELGCGSGASCCYLATQGFMATGMDIVPQAIKQAQTGCETNGSAAGSCQFVLQDAWDLINDNDHDGCIDLLFDCQTFHVLRQKDEKTIVNIYHKLLADGGLLVVLTGNANEAEVGPSVLTRDELEHAFDKERFECVSIEESRFDSTPAYSKLEQCPLAWVGVFRKRVISEKETVPM
eukprot:m.38174 g.38174  ORF g.38174 m.38174 type:complete len:228 (+) comp12579_c0_seq2:483-1166(+)